MKIFVAQLLMETNTFTAFPSGMKSFEDPGLFRGNGSVLGRDTVGAYMAEMRAWIEADGHSMIESLCASAQPSGPTVRSAFEELRDAILADLRSCGPVDAVVLHLHGAMVAEGVDDCEGDILDGVRAIVGQDVPVAVEVDLHCHLTDRMVRAANLIAAYQLYPHLDILARGRHVLDLAMAMARGAVRPTTSVFDCRMVGIWPTSVAPMNGFVRRMKELEGRAGVLSVSLGHGFPWGDVPESGAKLWVVTDDDPRLAQELASELGRSFWDMRDATRPRLSSVDEALDIAADTGRCCVLADVADNAGGGAPGDSTFILRRMLERGVTNAAIGLFWDLGAIQVCREAGVGATFDLRVGGKCGPVSGDPVDVRVTVRALCPDHSQDGLDQTEALGFGVLVETDKGIAIALASTRCQVFSPSAFTRLGLDLSTRDVIVVKSTQHFYDNFAPLARRVVYVSTEGALRQDFERIPYRNRDHDYWPRVTDPWHRGAAD